MGFRLGLGLALQGVERRAECPEASKGRQRVHRERTQCGSCGGLRLAGRHRTLPGVPMMTCSSIWAPFSYLARFRVRARAGFVGSRFGFLLKLGLGLGLGLRLGLGYGNRTAPLLTQDALDAHARLLYHVLPHLEHL